MAIYGSYDQAALDAQYNNRALVPDHEDYFARWDEQSEAARDRLTGHLDIAYGMHERARLDIFPAEEQPSPALVFIHGGYWQFMGKEQYSFPAPAFVDTGVSYVAVGYPLCPAVSIDTIVSNICEALAWLWRNADAYGIDPRHLQVPRHSAGGHLTAMALATDWPELGIDLEPKLARTGTAISGLYDLEPIRLSYLNAGLGLDAEAAVGNSPIRQIPDAAAPLLLAVGGDESDEFRRQQNEFLAAWRGPTRPATSMELPGKNHFSIVDQLGDPDSLLFQGVSAMIWEAKDLSARIS